MIDDSQLPAFELDAILAWDAGEGIFDCLHLLEWMKYLRLTQEELGGVGGLGIYCESAKHGAIRGLSFMAAPAKRIWGFMQGYTATGRTDIPVGVYSGEMKGREKFEGL